MKADSWAGKTLLEEQAYLPKMPLKCNLQQLEKTADPQMEKQI